MIGSHHFLTVEKLQEFPFDIELLSCRSEGKFPDMAIRINSGDTDFTGGELIELKDSVKGYSVASFNSTIPTGKKDIHKVAPLTSSIYTQMVNAGDNVEALPEREVFYLVRGRRRDSVKVCLVHGSFFETIKVEELIRASFSQVFAERIEHGEFQLEESVKELLIDLFSDQESFSKTRSVEQASVSLRFRVMAGAKIEANILNPTSYPTIADNTLNLIVPCHSSEIEEQEYKRMQLAAGTSEYTALRKFKIKHWLNGEFLVFQTEIGASN